MYLQFLRALLVALPGVVAAEQSVSPVFGKYAPAPRFEETVSSSFYLPMRDGVRLAIKLERPAESGRPAEGRFPIVWQHALTIEPEMRDNSGALISGFSAVPLLARHGYIVAEVARRGTGQSFGVRRGYHDRNEAEDAYEITQWLASQPWSDGNVGMYGCSNTGDAALHAMTVRPPALRAVFAGCFSWHKFDAFRRGGVFAQWGTGPARSIADDMSLPSVDGDENKDLLRIAAAEHQLSAPLLQMWQELPYRDSWSPSVGSRFWSEGSAASYVDQLQRSGIALYIAGGWRDELRDQAFITYLNVPNSRVIVGPWAHCRNDDFPLLGEIQRFFDFHLKGVDTAIDKDPAVHYFTVNANGRQGWRSADSWPPPESRFVDYHLGPGSLGEGNRAAFEVEFETNPALVCPVDRIDSRSQPCHIAGKGLTFESEPLGKDTEVTGHPLVDIWIKSNRDDANIFAYLEDVAPDGGVTVVTEGRLKASVRKEADAPWKMPAGTTWHRAYQADVELLQLDESVHLRFSMMPISWVYRKGHRIQLAITGSDYRERLTSREPAAEMISLISTDARVSKMSLPIVDGAQ